MNTLGYLSLFGAILFYIGMISFNNPRPNMSGDYGMGYGLGLIFFALCYAFCMVLLGVSLASLDALKWINVSETQRNLLIIAGVIFASVTFLLCSALKYESTAGVPGFLTALIRYQGEIWVHPMLLIPIFILLNSQLREALPAWSYQIPITIAFIIQGLFSISMFVAYVVHQNKLQVEMIAHARQYQDDLHNRYLETIENFSDSDNIITILPYTGRYHETITKEKALEKIKSRPDWEQELLSILESEYHFSEVYTFIDENYVDHPELFAEPLNQSIFRLSKEIVKRIKEANNLQTWHFDHFGIERLLRALDGQFAHSGTDFVPAIKALRDALRTTPPERFKGIEFDITREVEAWLKKHK